LATSNAMLSTAVKSPNFFTNSWARIMQGWCV
jgi:hypothetical protein